MMNSTILDALAHFESLAYLGCAALLFILALAGLSKQKTAQRGNFFGIAGMVLALVAVILVTLVSSTQPLGPVVGFMTAAIIIGAIIGIWRAKTVQMTAMPAARGNAALVRGCGSRARGIWLVLHDAR